MNTYNLTLLRSDQGDGGWSLHPPRYPGEEDLHDKLLISGPAKLVGDDWDRPNQADYDKAARKYWDMLVR